MIYIIKHRLFSLYSFFRFTSFVKPLINFIITSYGCTYIVVHSRWRPTRLYDVTTWRWRYDSTLTLQLDFDDTIYFYFSFIYFISFSILDVRDFSSGSSLLQWFPSRCHSLIGPIETCSLAAPNLTNPRSPYRAACSYLPDADGAGFPIDSPTTFSILNRLSRLTYYPTSSFVSST